MSHKHEHLLRAIFHDPISANIHWREIESLLHHVGADVEPLSGARIRVRLNGAEGILHHCEKRLKIHAGETTADGMFTLVEEECLAACADAPMMICGDKYFMRLDTNKVDTALDELRKHPRSEH